MIQGDIFYLFYETKNPFTVQGDIGVAKSIDKGATWQQLGMALDEDWHLSYPYVFNYLGQVRLSISFVCFSLMHLGYKYSHLWLSLDNFKRLMIS